VCSFITTAAGHSSLTHPAPSPLPDCLLACPPCPPVAPPPPRRYLYCNLPGFDFVQGSSARLYFMAVGTKADMHTPNSAEAQLFMDGHKRQALSLLPGNMLTVDTT
jgi:hypothetical protein